MIVEQAYNDHYRIEVLSYYELLTSITINGAIIPPIRANIDPVPTAKFLKKNPQIKNV